MSRIDYEIKNKISDDKQRCIVNLMFTASWIRNLFTEFLKPYNISNQQYNILRILRGAKGWLEMSEVKNRMIEKAPNATRLADKLLDKGLIERCRSDKDRRIVHVRITKMGLDLLKELDEIDAGPQVEFMNRLTIKDAREVSRVLEKLRG